MFQQKTALITNPKQVRILAVVFGLVFIGFSLFLGYLSYRQFLMERAWNVVDARLVSASSAGRRGSSYHVRYEYLVDGQLYEGSGQTDYYPSGNFVVLVNPDRPGESGLFTSVIGSIIWILISLPLGIALVFFAKPA